MLAIFEHGSHFGKPWSPIKRRRLVTFVITDLVRQTDAANSDCWVLSASNPKSKRGPVARGNADVPKSGREVACFQLTWVSTTSSIELSVGVHVDKKGLVFEAAPILQFYTDNDDSLIVATEMWSPLHINRSDDSATVLFDTISIADGLELERA
ncbi:hypothetical protein BLNAU_2002 [Blattamonas nauphoetae]|uniref:Uncharacterized protein n=1 Tax=Blattamonas nauphoetae TaxID=2049346 RepID=A0ABQ9YGU5_9EUKA|nr:hypothetical protein BLNAU_2002 [Blattamonas nauphoetae]